MLNVAYLGKRLRFGTGISLEPKHWNAARQEPRSSDPLRNVNFRRLTEIAHGVKKSLDAVTHEHAPSQSITENVDRLRRHIKKFLNPDASVLKTTGGILSDFDEFIDTYTMRSRSGMITTQRPGERTIRFYRVVRASLQEFSDAYRRELSYESVDESFYSGYYTWLSHERSLSDSTVSNFIKVLKTFMKWAKLKGYHSSSSYESFYRDKRTSESIALTVDELRIIRNCDLSDSPRLSRVRDHFLLQCYTGMRYGDLLRLETKHFDDNAGVIRFTTQKTDTPCIVPLTKPLRELLERYPSRMFEFASDVKQNLYLKELGRRLGFDQQIIKSKYVAGKRVEEVKNKFDLLTTHVARRSFATTSLRFGVPEAVIAVVTGHSAKGMLQRHYFRLDEEAVRDIIVKAWDQL